MANIIQHATKPSHAPSELETDLYCYAADIPEKKTDLRWCVTWHVLEAAYEAI